MNDKNTSSSSSSSSSSFVIDNNNTSSVVIRKTSRPSPRTDFFYNSNSCQGNIIKEERNLSVPSQKTNAQSNVVTTNVVAKAPRIKKVKPSTTSSTTTSTAIQLDWSQWRSKQANKDYGTGGGLINAFIESARQNELGTEEDMEAFNFQKKRCCRSC